MKMVKRYVVNSKLRLTTGMVISGIGIIALGWAIYMILWEYSNNVIHRYTTGDYFVRIAGFLIFIFLIWLGRYADKKQQWPDYIIEIYDNGFMHYQLKYKSGATINDCWIPMDKIVKIGSYKKIYYKRKKNWYILFDFGFTNGKKVYGPFFRGWLIEPKNIKEIDEFVETIKRLGEKNRKKMKMEKIPHPVTWYGVSTWEETEEAQRIKDEMRKMLEEGGNGNAGTD